MTRRTRTAEQIAEAAGMRVAVVRTVLADMDGRLVVRDGSGWRLTGRAERRHGAALRKLGRAGR